VTSLLGATSGRLGAEEPAGPVDDSWDMSWVDRLAKAKARAVFDSPEISDGEAVWKAMMWADQYAQVYGTPRSQIVPVLVFRHMGIALAMSDSYWKRFNVGKEKKVLNAQGKEWAESNPVLLPPTAGSTDPDYSLPKFFEAGGIVLACNLAFTFAAAPYKKELKTDSAGARAAALKDLIPGVILQPSGIFAVMRAQEAGAGYMLSSAP
jgi:hypothetical protein